MTIQDATTIMFLMTGLIVCLALIVTLRLCSRDSQSYERASLKNGRSGYRKNKVF